MTADQKMVLFWLFTTAGALWGLYYRAREVQRKRIIPDIADYLSGATMGAVCGLIIVFVVSVSVSFLNHIAG